MSTWSGLLVELLEGRSLTAEQTHWAMAEIMAGEASDAQIAAFVVALRAKGETPAEVNGVVAAMLDNAVRLPVPLELSARAVDTCGTGGDRAHTVNISTMAALVVAGAGIPVIKHGNRAASSQTGSADLLEALGIELDLPPAGVARCVSEAGIGFCFATMFHPALRYAGPTRRDLGIPTIFNVLGPLTNPAQPGAQAVGVSSLPLAPVMAQVLAARGTSALLFRGSDGLDELTPVTTSQVWVVRDGAVTEEVVDPADLGIPRVELEALRGGDAATNAAVARQFLAGEPGAVRDAVLLNAAAAIAAARAQAGGLLERLRDGLDIAREALDSGAAARTLDRWREISLRARG
jgi:anthranilate phosphoribosyltransferase